MDFSEIIVWDDLALSELRNTLINSADEKYRSFHTALVPDAEEGYILGVRMPILRELAKSISKGNGRGFLEVCNDKYYEERMLKGLVTGYIKPDSFEDFIALCEGYVPLINNWALCDSFCSGLKKIKKYREQSFEYLLQNVRSGEPWRVRFSLVCMLNYYLDEEYIDRVLEVCDSIESDFYYVSMAQAWLLATAFAKCREKTYAYFLSNKLNQQTFNRAVQKCIDSYRVSAEDKAELKEIRQLTNRKN